MFSLIISLIAIALVALLAGATAYFGGSAFTEGGAKSEVARYANGAQQVQASSTLYVSEYQKLPGTVADLVAAEYLAEEPWPKGAWQFSDGFVETPGHMAQASCETLMRRVSDGTIPETRQAGLHEQCYGSEAPYTYAYLAAGLPWTQTAQPTESEYFPQENLPLSAYSLDPGTSTWSGNFWTWSVVESGNDDHINDTGHTAFRIEHRYHVGWVTDFQKEVTINTINAHPKSANNYNYTKLFRLYKGDSKDGPWTVIGDYQTVRNQWTAISFPETATRYMRISSISPAWDFYNHTGITYYFEYKP